LDPASCHIAEVGSEKLQFCKAIWEGDKEATSEHFVSILENRPSEVPLLCYFIATGL